MCAAGHLFLLCIDELGIFFFYALLAPGALPAVGVLLALGSLGLEDLSWTRLSTHTRTVSQQVHLPCTNAHLFSLPPAFHKKASQTE